MISQKIKLSIMPFMKEYPMLIGSHREPSKELKIKELVDLAGLSLLQLKLKEKNGSKEELLELTLNNNSTLVILPTVDAKEVS